MSDLISRRSLIASLNKFAPEHYNALVNMLIEKEPCAYDVDEVVEKLETLSDEMNDKILTKDSPLYYDGYEDGVDAAIEIVKRGGLSKGIGILE